MGKPRIFTEEEKQTIYNLYTNGGTVALCCKTLHCGQDALRRALKELGIYKDHKTVMKTLPQNQVKYPVNEQFFETMNDKLAYVLGFLAADGCVSSSSNLIDIKLSKVDEDFLKMLREYIGGRPITYYTTQTGFDVACYSFCSQRVKQTLAQYNIVPRKTFTYRFPTNIPYEYQIDFIRGYFDGDGSVSTAGPSAIRWQLCSATPDVLEKICDYFFKRYQIEKTSIMVSNKNRKNNFYYIQYSSCPTRQIYHALYYKDDILYLPRKKQKYEEIYNRNLKK